MSIANEFLHVQTRRHNMPSNSSLPAASKLTTTPTTTLEANDSYALTVSHSYAPTGDSLCYEIILAAATTTTQLKLSNSDIRNITTNNQNSIENGGDKPVKNSYKINTKLNLISKKLMQIDGIKYLKMQRNCDLNQQKLKPKRGEQEGTGAEDEEEEKAAAMPLLSRKEHFQEEEESLPLLRSEQSNKQQQHYHTTTPQSSTPTPTPPSTPSSPSSSSLFCLLFLLLPQLQQIHTRPLSSLQLSLLLCCLLIAQIAHLPGILAAPQSSCIYCREEDLKAQQQQQQQLTVQHLKDAGAAAKNYEEFLFEHQVTRKDAIAALKALNETFYLGPAPESACKSVVCTKKVMNYCLGPQFINDHCWCELGHTEEGLPYVPHICYVGEKVYTASVGSCFFYEEVKECCCAPALATQYRHISAGAIPTSQYNTILLLLCWAFLLQQLRRACY